MVFELHRAQQMDVQDDVGGVEILGRPTGLGHDGLRGVVHGSCQAGQRALLQQGGDLAIGDVTRRRV